MGSNLGVKDEPDVNNSQGFQPPTVQPISRALSDGSREDTPIHTYKHSWTSLQRLTLTILAESFSNDWDDLTSVFNICHANELRRCGGLRKAVVYTQYRDMRKKFDAAAALRTLQDSRSPYDKSFLVTPHGLEKKAAEIGIRLKAKGSIGVSNQNRMPNELDNPERKKRKRANSFDDSRTDYLPTDGAAHEFGLVHGLRLPRTPPRKNGKLPHNGLLTPPVSGKRSKPRLTAEKRLAGIGFRAITAQSQGVYSPTLGIRAGAFINCPYIPLARDLSITEYRSEALHHVKKYDYSRPSKFISTTTNPMRAIHMLLRGPPGEKGVILVDLNAADEHGNVEKARDLKLKTTWKYSSAGEYLIFGGVDPRAIISYIPLSRLLSKKPTAISDQDPFRFRVLEANEKLSYARSIIQKDVLPMTYSLGKAVGHLVGLLSVPPRHFENAVWAFVQDYKFYKAEGGKRRHWADNTAFKDGAVQGYQAVRNDKLASLEIEKSIKTARETIEIDDDEESDQISDSDSVASHEDVPTPERVEHWIRETQANQAPLQYYDVQTSRWMNREEDLSSEFLGELRDVGKDNMDIPTASDPRYNGLEMDIDSATGKSLAVPAGHFAEESRHLDELCADVMNMHGDERIILIQKRRDVDADYEFAWTGM